MMHICLAASCRHGSELVLIVELAIFSYVLIPTSISFWSEVDAPQSQPALPTSFIFPTGAVSSPTLGVITLPPWETEDAEHMAASYTRSGAVGGNRKLQRPQGDAPAEGARKILSGPNKQTILIGSAGGPGETAEVGARMTNIISKHDDVNGRATVGEAVGTKASTRDGDSAGAPSAEGDTVGDIEVVTAEDAAPHALGTEGSNALDGAAVGARVGARDRKSFSARDGGSFGALIRGGSSADGGEAVNA